MTRRVLIDTNVLVNVVDPLEGAKARIANMVFTFLADASLAVISTQVITEYFLATTRGKGGRQPIFTRQEAALSIDGLVDKCVCVSITTQIAQTAVRHAAAHQMRVYDAQMWAVAHSYGIPYLLTEDDQYARRIEGVRYVNPFAESFALTDLGL